MNQKKCPKCGENNPVEGVMCWACYTPLTGGAGGGPMAAAGAGMGGVAAPGAHGPPLSSEDKPKSQVAPWQIGLIAAVVLGGGFMGFRSMNPGSSSVTPDLPPPPTPTTGDIPVPIGPAPAPTPGQPPPPPAPPAPPTTGGDPQAYAITTPPSVKTRWATMGIVPTVSVNKTMAASMASQARQRVIAAGGRWSGIYVYAFADRQTAAAFQRYQSERGGALLQPADYPALQAIWSKTQARYEYRNGQEAVRYPQDDPNNWFRGESKWSKAH